MTQCVLQVSVQGQPHDAKNDGTHELNSFENLIFDVIYKAKNIFLSSLVGLSFEFSFWSKIDVFKILDFAKLEELILTLWP